MRIAAAAFANERIPQIAAEDSSYTRQIDADDGVTSASPGQICEPGAKWIRLGFKDLSLKGYDSLTVSGAGGSSYTFEGDKWDGISFSSRAIEGECVQIRTYFADPASHYSLDSTSTASSRSMPAATSWSPPATSAVATATSPTASVLPAS